MLDNKEEEIRKMKVQMNLLKKQQPTRSKLQVITEYEWSSKEPLSQIALVNFSEQQCFRSTSFSWKDGKNMSQIQVMAYLH